MTLNFHKEIKELKEKLKKSQDTLVDFKTSYRKLQDRIDVLHKLRYDEKEQIDFLGHSINEVLTKLDSGINIIDIKDVKLLKNIEILVLINNAINQIKDSIDKRLLDFKKIDII